MWVVALVALVCVDDGLTFVLETRTVLSQERQAAFNVALLGVCLCLYLSVSVC